MKITWSARTRASLAQTVMPPALRTIMTTALREQIVREEVTVRLLAVTPRERLPVVSAEVTRRREQLGMTEIAAKVSVTDDLITGRWMLP